MTMSFLTITRLVCLGALGFVSVGAANAQTRPESVEAVYAERSETALVLQVEAAMALAQGELGVIPADAASAICAAADPDLVTVQALADEYAIVRHRMVAMLNVWRRSMPEEAGEYLHFGATTVDIYDTVAIMQVRTSVLMMIEQMQAIELSLIELAESQRDTPMMGRTLGQHALPITFGKKLGVWIGENRRHIDRLSDLLNRLDRSAILKGAVGSYYGLGDEGMAVETAFAQHLGFDTPYPADWHGSRDVFAEYAATLALIAGTWERFGQEVFLLQATDIGEVVERRPSTAVGSSTMPHKSNPSLSEALIHHGRVTPRLAAIVIDDMVSFFERDNTSRSNRAVGELSIAAADMLSDAGRLITRLEVNEAAMRANLDRTDGMIMSQQVVFALAERLGRVEAEERVRAAAFAAATTPGGFRAALAADPDIAAVLSEDDIAALLDPTTYLGLAGAQLDRTIAEARTARANDPGFDDRRPVLACPPEAR